MRVYEVKNILCNVHERCNVSNIDLFSFLLVKQI